MSQRAQELVQRFDAANNAMIHYIEACSEEELNQVTSGEGWSVRVAAHHIAVSHEPVAGFVHLVASGAALPPLTIDLLNQMNAQHAAEHAHVSKTAILDGLRQNGAKAASMIAGLTDEQLDRSAHLPTFGATMSAQAVAENILIRHIDHHLESIKAAVGK